MKIKLHMAEISLRSESSISTTDLTSTSTIIKKLRIFRAGSISHSIIAAILIIGLATGNAFFSLIGFQATIEQQLSFSISEFASLFAWPAYVSVLFAFIAGLVISFLGIRISCIIFTGVSLIGHIILSFGALIDPEIVVLNIKLNYLIILVGLIVRDGLGWASINILVFTLIPKYFKKTETMFGVCTSILAIGMFIGINLMQIIYSQVKTFFPVSSGFSIVSFTFFFYSIFYLIGLLDSIILYFFDQWTGISTEKPITSVNAEVPPEVPKLKIKDLLKLRLDYWLYLFTGIFLSASFSFVQLAQVFFMRKYELTVIATNIIISLFSFMTGKFILHFLIPNQSLYSFETSSLKFH